VPNRKQRRRREKDFRHDVRVFEVDDEGNEVPIAELRAQDAKPAKTPAKANQGSRSSRAPREVQPPSWERAFKRGGLMGAAMLVVFLLLFKNGPAVQRVIIPIFYAVAFIPLTYWIDRTAYRAYQRRINKPAATKTRPAAKKS